MDGGRHLATDSVTSDISIIRQQSENCAQCKHTLNGAMANFDLSFQCNNSEI